MTIQGIALNLLANKTCNNCWYVGRKSSGILFNDFGLPEHETCDNFIQSDTSTIGEKPNFCIWKSKTYALLKTHMMFRELLEQKNIKRKISDESFRIIKIFKKRLTKDEYDNLDDDVEVIYEKYKELDL